MTIVSLVIGVLLALNGLFFVSNIVVAGRTEAARRMHSDLSPSAAPWMVHGKVIVCFVSGVLYALGAWGLWRQQVVLVRLAGLGAGLFLAYYFLELAAFGRTHRMVWIGFAIFGGLASVFLVSTLLLV